MKNIFSEVQFKKGNKTLFPMSHDRKFSMNMGELVPILCEEVIPGDTWKCKSEALIRMAPMLAPVMHRLNIQTHFFFVPNRLVWNEWEDFITGGPTGTSNPVMPYLNIQGQFFEMSPGGLPDYLGCSSSDGSGAVTSRINALPFRAYQLIYNEYYRDQDLETEIEFSRDSGDEGVTLSNCLALRNRSWEKDLFTSARPFTQKGAEVEVPIIGNAPVLFDRTGGTGRWIKENGGQAATGAVTMVDSLGDSMLSSGGTRNEYDPNGTLEADLSGATSTTIADLRNAARLQEHLEKNMRGGSRYVEQMLVHFGVVSDDARLQRPEYLGGGKVPMVISEVLQTSETATTAQGNLSGHGVSAGASPSWKSHFKEHGYIIGIISVLPKTSYYQGFRRHLLKDDKYDYFWRDFEHIGEQGIYPAELYHDFDGDLNKGTFGYNMRYYEYKYIPSSVHGDFKNSLEYWHMGRKFASNPTLNKNFVQSDPTDRIFAVQDSSDKLYCQVYNDISAIRLMSRFSNPKL